MEHDDDNQLLGVDVKQLVDDYENGLEVISVIELKMYTLFDKAEEILFMLGVWKKMSSLSEFKKHYGSYHYTKEEFISDRCCREIRQER